MRHTAPFVLSLGLVLGLVLGVALPAVAAEPALVARSASGSFAVYAPVGAHWCAREPALQVRVPNRAALTTSVLQQAVSLSARLADVDCPALERLHISAYVGDTAEPALHGVAARTAGWVFTPRPGGPEPARERARAAALSPEDERFLRAVENLAWVPVGPPSDQQVYVISAPWCGFCRDLYKRTKSATGVQFRWVKTGARNDAHRDQIAAATLTRDPTTLDAIYLTGEELPRVADRAAVERINAFQSAGIQALYDELSRRSGGGWGYPTLIYASAHGVRVEGASREPLRQLADVAARPGARELVPAAYRLAREGFDESPLQGTVFAKRPTAVRALPHPDAPVILELDAQNGFRAASHATVDGQRWYGVTPFRSGTRGYVAAADAHHQP